MVFYIQLEGSHLIEIIFLEFFSKKLLKNSAYIASEYISVRHACPCKSRMSESLYIGLLQVVGNRPG